MGYVDRDNRHGDRFPCLRYGHAGDADGIASWNIDARVDDPEIRRWTPKEKVRQILMTRYRRRSKGASALTAPGKTPAVACGSSSADDSGFALRRRANKARDLR